MRATVGRRSDIEGCHESIERGIAIACGKGFHADRPCIAHPLQGTCDAGLVDFAGARFAAAGIVGDLHLADLRVIEIEVDAQLRAVHRRDK